MKNHTKPIPCIANKCLLYPTCRHKEVINCNEIVDYHNYLMHKQEPIYLYSECFDLINDTLKSMREYSTIYFGLGSNHG